MPDTPPHRTLFTAKSLTKSFGEVRVLSNIDLQVNQGEVLALLGENGAGKSTLVKLIGGYETVSGGLLHLANEAGELKPLNSDTWKHATAEAQGVILIHQELNLAEQLNAVENIFLGNEIRRGPFLDKHRMLELTREYLSILD